MGVLKSTTEQWSWQKIAKGKLRTLLHTGSALAMVLTLGACSSVPDAVNPIEWGKSVGNMFDGEDENSAKSDEAIPGEDGEYPSLSDTPAKPIVTGDDERDALIAGLAADRQNAQYEQGGRRQSTAPVNALQPPEPAPEPVQQDQPEIQAAPTTSVSSSEIAQTEPAPTPAPAAQNTGSGEAASSGSSIADQWTAKSAASGPVPTPEAAPERPAIADEGQGEGSATSDADRQRQQQLEAYRAAQAAEADQSAQASGNGSAPASTGDPVMDQYQRRLNEGSGVFANEPAPMPQGQDFDYSMYAGDGSVVVDESQLGSSDRSYGGAGYDEGSIDMVEANQMLASRLGVRSIDSLGQSINGTQLAQIQFGHGSTSLGGNDGDVLQQVANTWRQTGGVLRVIGHASMRTGNMSLQQHMAVNQRVSEGRASAVVSRLLSLGVSPGAIFVGADGSEMPRYYEGVPAGEAGNRRVEIYLDY
ncbi:OmpA family protein [Thalassospira sp. MA62]|nr:OmpA family protein [Thalassospira sp. MA62]